MSFLEVIVKNKKEIGTWSTSSLIPCREDIIPRWSQLLTTLLGKGPKNYSEEKVMVVCNTLVKIL